MRGPGPGIWKDLPTSKLIFDLVNRHSILTKASSSIERTYHVDPTFAPPLSQFTIVTAVLASGFGFSAITTVFLSKVNGGAVVTVPLIGQLCVVTSMLCCHSFGVNHFWFVVSARWRHHIEAVISNHSRAAFTIPSLHEAGLVLH